MSAKRPRRPKYCGPHNPSGVGYVWWKGKQVYFKGHPHMSAASLAAYDRWCREHIEAEIKPGDGDIKTVARLSAIYMRVAQQKYHGGELHNVKSAVGVLLRIHGETVIADFGPLALQDVRNEMISLGWSRPYVNRQVRRICRIFDYGVSQQIVRPETIVALRTVEALRESETSAPETEPVEPVPWAHVNATLAECGPVISAMLRLQMSTGLRSVNVCRMTAEQIDRDDWIWLYVPRQHKTKHRRKTLVVPLGPRAQAAIWPFLWWRESDAPLFSPQEAARLHYERSSRERTTKPKGHWKTRFGAPPIKHVHQANHRIGAAYTSLAYYRAIQRACDRAFPAPDGLDGDALAAWRDKHRWTPRQLRHTVATDIRETHGVEAAQAYLGHASITATQIYAETSLRRALEIAQEFG